MEAHELLTYKAPFEGIAILRFLERRAIRGVEVVDGSRYRRTVTFGRSAGTIGFDLAANNEQVLLTVRLDDLRDLTIAVQRCRQLLDLDADPAAIAEILGADEPLAPLVRHHPGLRVPGAMEGWEIAVRAVLGQQVSIVSARTLLRRLVHAFGEPIHDPEDGLTHFFPTAEAIVEGDLRGLGITERRAGTLRALAGALIRGELVLDSGAEPELVACQLQRLPGIGPWTAAYVAMRALHDPDAFPASDLGLRQAFNRLGLDSRPDQVIARAERWRPWRAYAAMHLWESVTE